MMLGVGVAIAAREELPVALLDCPTDEPLESDPGLCDLAALGWIFLRLGCASVARNDSKSGYRSLRQ